MLADFWQARTIDPPVMKEKNVNKWQAWVKIGQVGLRCRHDFYADIVQCQAREQIRTGFSGSSIEFLSWYSLIFGEQPLKGSTCWEAQLVRVSGAHYLTSSPDLRNHLPPLLIIFTNIFSNFKADHPDEKPGTDLSYGITKRKVEQSLPQMNIPDVPLNVITLSLDNSAAFPCTLVLSGRRLYRLTDYLSTTYRL